MSIPDKTNEIKEQLSGLADQPGVYLFLNDQEEIIYIGKAISLKARVRSYWNKNAWKERSKLAVMMPRVAKIDTILTHSDRKSTRLNSSH